MANILKIKTTRAVPADATIVDKNGKPHIKLNRNGRTVLRPVIANGKRYRDESRKWYVQVKMPDGKWKRFVGYADKESTRQLAADIERKLERQQAGLADPFEDAARELLSKHIDDFANYLMAKGDTEKHVSITKNRIMRLVEGCKFKHSSDIVASRVAEWLADQREAGAFGKKTSNYYQGAFKEFCEWMMKDRRAANNPVAFLSLLSCQDDVRRKRRSISTEEFERLLAAAEASGAIQCMSGPERALLYIVAAWTGYRRNELASMTTSSVQFEANPPTISVDAAYSKRRRNDSIPMHPYVEERLRNWFSITKPEKDAPLFSLKSANGYLRATAKMMRLDLATARATWIKEADSDEERSRREASDFLTYQDEAGLYADFHANRHTFISNLSRAGVSAKMAQTLARHSDPKLTLNIYTHVSEQDQAGAIAGLPAPPSAKPNDSAEHAELLVQQEDGDTKSVAHMVAQGVAQAGDFGGQSESSIGNTSPVVVAGAENQKPLPLVGLGVESHPVAPGDESSGGGIRTPDTRIMIPLL